MINKVISKDESINQKKTETSLIERFLYPKYGPGQMWQETAKIIQSRGGELYLNHRVKKVTIVGNIVESLTVTNLQTKKDQIYLGDYFFSTMPVKDLINSVEGSKIPKNVKETANGLVYRDFITIGLLLKKLNVQTKNENVIKTSLPDNWIYIQEKDVKVGRIQIFNNWSPYMVKDSNNIWLGLEYFCDEGDELWSKSDDELKNFAINELILINFILREDVLDAICIRMPKTYPAYFGTYDNFNIIRDYTDKIHNLFLIGRNGMHKYNNQDHSMLTAMTAVENIANGIKSKDNIWEVNTEKKYHEKK